MGDPSSSVRDQLLAGAAAYDWWELWPQVAGARLTLLQALAPVTDAQSRWRPPGGQGEAAWSILEVAHHVLAYSQNVLAIIEAAARGATVTKDPPGTLAGAAGLSIQELQPLLVERSARIASVIERLPAEPDLATTVDHAFFGPLNSRAWFLFLALHDSDHARQLQALKQIPGFPTA